MSLKTPLKTIVEKKITLRGINLYCQDGQELHKFVRKFGINKGWFHLIPSPHYDVICPRKVEAIRKYLKINKNGE